VDPAIPSVGLPVTKTALNSAPVRSRKTVQSESARHTPDPRIYNHQETQAVRAGGQRRDIQIASTHTSNTGFYHRSYERPAVYSLNGDRSPAGSIDTTASTAAAAQSSRRVNGGDARSWWEVLKASDRLEAERDRISLRQIAQDTAKPSARSGEIDLATANQEFANPLTSATMVIIENDTVLLDGNLASGTETTNITVFEPIIPVSLGDTGWSLVNRPILPFAINAPIPVAGSGGSAGEGGTLSFEDNDGLGDFTFFSLLAPSVKGNFKYGFGPTFQFPTSTKKKLGQGKYSAGPAAVGLYSSKSFTLGMLTQTWLSYAGDKDRDNVAKSTFQYFAFYNFTPEWGIGTAPIISVNWDAKGGDMVALPVGAGVTRTFRLGKLPARVLLEGQYYAVQRRSFGPEWNFRIALGIFLPKLFGQ
jgi:hypothetical protein